uniref:Uncharacterized protein n=1 Tax=Noccaea caerulescens TaxID=107243 RepID=A0A1J3CQH0_NOCCA
MECSSHDGVFRLKNLETTVALAERTVSRQEAIHELVESATPNNLNRKLSKCFFIILSSFSVHSLDGEAAFFQNVGDGLELCIGASRLSLP